MQSLRAKSTYSPKSSKLSRTANSMNKNAVINCLTTLNPVQGAHRSGSRLCKRPHSAPHNPLGAGRSGRPFLRLVGLVPVYLPTHFPVSMTAGGACQVVTAGVSKSSAQGTSWVTMLDCFSATALKLNRATFELLVLACCELCRKHAQRCSELL